MCGITPNPLAEHENDDFCAEALLSLQSVKEQELDRFYCPFPGCKRSFAELWRLKVHFRAPPNVRGSGKERGHGMRLTHCPKCGTALKIGGHHVRCSAREAARQHMQLAKKPSRRNATTSASASAAVAPPTAQQQPLQQLQQEYMPLQTEQQHEPSAAPREQSEQQLHSIVQQYMAQQSAAAAAAAAAAAGAGTADQDDDTYAYPYQHQQQQHQQWADQSAWYAQQQEQLDCGYEAAGLADQQHLQRLQELLRRVDQHLGYDQEPAQPMQLQHYSSTSSFSYGLGEPPQQQQHSQLFPAEGGGSSSIDHRQYLQEQQQHDIKQHSALQQSVSCPSSDSCTNSAAEGSSGDGSTGAGTSGLSAATTAVVSAAADTDVDYSSYFTLLAQQLQLQQQQQTGSGLPQLLQQLQQQLAHPQQEPALLSVQLPPPQPLDCGLVTDLSLQQGRDVTPPAAAAVGTSEGTAAAAAGDLSGLPVAAGLVLGSNGGPTAAAGAATESSSDQQLGLLQVLLQKALAAANGSEGSPAVAAAAGEVPSAAAPQPLSSEAELLRLLQERCMQ